MKAILVIDEMPNVCANCLLNIDGLCAGTREPIHSISCPLKPMPQLKNISDRKITYEELRERIGWNDCIEELEK